MTAVCSSPGRKWPIASRSSANRPPGRWVQNTRKTGVAGQNGQLGPDGEQALGAAQKLCRSRCWGRTRGYRHSGRSPGRRGARTAPEHALDSHGRRKVAAQEHLGLRMNAARVKAVVELARDVPGPLNQQPKRDTAPKQPVHPRDMCPQVAADQDRASTFRERGAQAFVAAHVEAAQDGFVGLAVERVVAREKPGGVGGQGRPGRVDRPVGIERRAGRARAPRACVARAAAEATVASRPKNPRIASPRAGPSRRSAGRIRS